MKYSIKLIAVVAAFSAAAFTARAGIATTTSQLVLGVTDGTTNVLVNIGSINNYAPAGGPVATSFAVGNYSSVLNAAFGTTSTGLSWGIIGNAGIAAAATNGDAKGTAWITSAWDNSVAGSLGVQNSVAYDRGAVSTLNSTNVSVNGLYQALSGATAAQTTAASNAVTLTNNIWDNSVAFNLDGALFDNQITRLALGQNYSAADLYSNVPNGVAGSAEGSADSKFDGTFSLNATTGVLTFTAIPEPSMYAAILAIATLGFAAIRRRKQVQLLA